MGTEYGDSSVVFCGGVWGGNNFRDDFRGSFSNKLFFVGKLDDFFDFIDDFCIF